MARASGNARLLRLGCGHPRQYPHPGCNFTHKKTAGLPPRNGGKADRGRGLPIIGRLARQRPRWC
jgi:hypothetical protein